MTARLEISSAVPSDVAERIGDIGDQSDAETRQLWAEQDIVVRNKLASAEWWTDVLDEYCGPSEMLPAILARIMRELDNACSGDEIGRTAILTALAQLQREAKARARKEVEL